MNSARALAPPVALLIAVIGLAGCGRAAEAEFQRVRSGTLDVVLLSAREGLHHGRDSFAIEFRSAAGGNLVDVGAVRGTASMPMPGSSPMFATLDVSRTDTPGRYAAVSRFDMAGTWRTTLEWDGPAGRGSVTFPGAVQ